MNFTTYYQWKNTKPYIQIWWVNDGQAQPGLGKCLIEIGLNWANTGMIDIRVKSWNVSEVVSFR